MIDFHYKQSNSDERAMFVIACILVMCVGAFVAIEYFKNEATDQQASALYDSNQLTEAEITDHLHSFDPNTVDSATLLSFGLKPHQIKVFLNYRRKGAVFRNHESIAKIYTWDDEIIERLMPFVIIGDEYKSKDMLYTSDQHTSTDSRHRYGNGNYNNYGAPHDRQREAYRQNHTSPSDSSRHYHGSNKFTSPTRVDINTADSALLTRIPGIGSTTARSIIRLRERLGGFYSTSQVRQIGYLDENPELLAWLKTSAVNVRKVDVNTATFNTLRSHPYISYEQAKDILDYRRNYGYIADAEALHSIGIFTDEQLQQLLPYLDFSNIR